MSIRIIAGDVGAACRDAAIKCWLWKVITQDGGAWLQNSRSDVRLVVIVSLGAGLERWRWKNEQQEKCMNRRAGQVVLWV